MRGETFLEGLNEFRNSFISKVYHSFHYPGPTLLASGFFACFKSLSCAWLFATPWTVAHQAPPSTGILQVRTLECIVLPSSRGSSWPRDGTQVLSPLLVCRFFTTSTTWEALSVGLICSVNFGSLLPAFLLTPLIVCVPLPRAFYTWGELWMVADKRPANHTN